MDRIYYSHTGGGFIIDTGGIGTDLPEDAIELTYDEHAAIFNGLMAGFPLTFDANGKPQVILPDEPTNEEWIVTNTAEIKNKRDNLTQNGGYQVDGNWYHSDILSRTQQLGLYNLALTARAAGGLDNDLLPVTPWKTMNGVYVDLTIKLAEDIFNAAVISDSTIFNVAKNHIQALEQSADAKNYDYSTGWPVTYID